MRRLDDQRGAVAVMVAILMVALIGFAAIGVDVANMASHKQQLQNGADAAALAIAQACAEGDCGLYESAAVDLASQNRLDSLGTATILNGPLNPSTARVEVRAEGETQHWFAPIFTILDGQNHDSSPIVADATAVWGWPTGGTSMIPLALQECQFQYQLELQGGDIEAEPALVTIVLPKDLDAALKHQSPGENIIPVDYSCTSDMGDNVVPGGFGWLLPDGKDTCEATSEAGSTMIGSDPGKDLPCPASLIEKLRDQKILIPIYDDWGGTGAGAWYRIKGYAAFTIKGYEFVGSTTPKWGVPCPNTINTCISGYFEEYVDLSGSFDYGTGVPDFGSKIIKLVLE